MGRRGVSVGVVLALIGVGACSSGHRSVERAPQTAHVRITMYDLTNKSKIVQRLTGDLDFTHRRAEYRIDTDPGQNTVLHDVAIVNGSVEFAPLTASAKQLFPAAVVGRRHWVTYPARGAGTPASISNPYSGVAHLRAAGAKLADLGPARVEGQTTRHLHTVLTEPVRTSFTHATERVTDDIYVGAYDRVVRLVSTTSSTQDHALALRTETLFSAFGEPVHVTVPRESEVLRYSTSFAPTPKLRGAWQEVASGHDRGFAWRLFRAPADLDRVCWSFESTPKLQASTVGVVGGLPNAAQMRAALGSTGRWPEHAGHDATCTRTGGWQTDLQPIAAGVAGRTDAIVAVLAPDVVKGTVQVSGIGLTRGTRHALAIDDRFHGFVDLAPPPPLLSFGGGSGYRLTRRDGTQASCSSAAFAFTAGVGSVLDPCLQLPAVAAPNGTGSSLKLTLAPASQVPTFP